MTFATPAAFLALPLPWLIYLLFPRLVPRAKTALRVPFYHALQASLATNAKPYGKRRLLLPLIIWMLFVIALAGPRGNNAPLTLTRDCYNMMMVLDISASMSWADMSYNGRPASRLAIVKQAASKFVKERKLDKIGLILFGTRAYLQTPLTFDHKNVLMRIEDATPGLAGNATSIGDALGLAVKKLQTTANDGRIVILLTDGANTSGMLSPMKAAGIAADNNIKVYTIGLEAGKSGFSLGGLMLDNGAGDLDEGLLQQMAITTGGKYFRATDPKSLDNIYATINQLENVNDDALIQHTAIEYYPWPLGCGLILLLIWLLTANLRTGRQYG